MYVCVLKPVYTGFEYLLLCFCSYRDNSFLSISKSIYLYVRSKVREYTRARNTGQTDRLKYKAREKSTSNLLRYIYV